jgi:hypothetical protein
MFFQYFSIDLFTMELKILIYIIIGAIWLFAKLRKKSGDSPAEVPDFEPRKAEPSVPRNQPAKGLTFEELLREINDSKKPQQLPKPVSKPVYVDYDDDLKEESRSLENITSGYKGQDKSYKIYDDAKKQAFHRPSLEETMKLSDTDVSFGKFKAFEEEEQPRFLEAYMRELQDPEGFKKAFVMSEILQRKY